MGHDRACAECSAATEDDAELCLPCQEQADRAKPRRRYQLFLHSVGWGHALLEFVGGERERVGTSGSTDEGVRHPDRIERDNGRAWVREPWGWVEAPRRAALNASNVEGP